MLVKRAKTAGFCMGVSLALHKLDRAISANEQTNKRICTFGPIIHNPQVLADYEKKGVHCLSTPGEAKKGDVVLIRAHGITKGEEKDLHACGAEILDATCPRVKKAQLAIEDATADDSSLLLFGDADHPEVRGLVSYANKEHCVFASLKEVSDMELDPRKAWVLASQTTQDASVFEQIRVNLAGRLPKLRVLSTICDATGERQAEALKISSEVDGMVVIGGRQSGNTRRLAALAAENDIPTWHIERINEIVPTEIEGLSLVGLTAGASTPRYLIDEAEAWLSKLETKRS